MSGRWIAAASKLLLLAGLLGLLLSTTSCTGNVYYGVSAGPYVGYPYGGVGGYRTSYGGVMYGRPMYYP